MIDGLSRRGSKKEKKMERKIAGGNEGQTRLGNKEEKEKRAFAAAVILKIVVAASATA
jgi:hypothetical protein